MSKLAGDSRVGQAIDKAAPPETAHASPLIGPSSTFETTIHLLNCFPGTLGKPFFPLEALVVRHCLACRLSRHTAEFPSIPFSSDLPYDTAEIPLTATAVASSDHHSVRFPPPASRTGRSLFIGDSSFDPISTYAGNRHRLAPLFPLTASTTLPSRPVAASPEVRGPNLQQPP